MAVRDGAARDGGAGWPAVPPALAAAILEHLDSAHNLARWLLRDPVAAEDVVQEAVLRALTYGGGWRGGDARAWLLSITRHAALDWLAARGRRREETLDPAEEAARPDPLPDPEAALAARQASSGLAAAVAALPLELRECLMLRTVEEMSYRDIARVTGVPIGTVMSRLWRARCALLRVRVEA
ncbi:sigma-70 family RNA polymerase sigma factor [Paracraurococcus lichenis]|uniref:RNA polymerase sigma factor n=1 Tax=Paracraurococcus lichenis TaxID=3064888 RepID=A0ABT9DV20_9PROT|nr:sigma-70 family RNA polymerase sigma factor [Paracraurococcus sp. LOR1-02]MDO9707750.1 sigma-70 family RNA polymerase sigma factor [Paracraurococcus sp. LOR1-02]